MHLTIYKVFSHSWSDLILTKTLCRMQGPYFYFHPVYVGIFSSQLGRMWWFWDHNSGLLWPPSFYHTSDYTSLWLAVWVQVRKGLLTPRQRDRARHSWHWRSMKVVTWKPHGVGWEHRAQTDLGTDPVVRLGSCVMDWVSAPEKWTSPNVQIKCT